MNSDSDNLCDAGDDDDDNDGVLDGPDTSDLNPNVCGDSDFDGCDDCVNTGANGSGGTVLSPQAETIVIDNIHVGRSIAAAKRGSWAKSTRIA